MSLWLSRRRGFTLIELLVVITIIGILMTLVTVSIQPIQRRSRDSKRKADVNLFISGITLFQADFKLYPNYTFYLGKNGSTASPDQGAKNSFFDLGSDIAKCPNSGAGAPSKFATSTADYNTAFLKPGFISVNNFLVCLKYLDRELVDPKPNTNPELNYQYRISYDYSQFLVSSQTENTNDSSLTDRLFADGAVITPKRYFEGNGRNVRQMDDDTDAAPPDGFFYLGGSPVGAPLTNGRYFYQVAATFETGDYAPIDRDKRSLTQYDPIVYSNGSWIRNSIIGNNGDSTAIGYSDHVFQSH